MKGGKMEKSFVINFFNNLCSGNGSIVNSSNINKLNEIGLNIYNKSNLNKDEIETLKYLIMSCNILYNRTDMTVLPIEDGFYDLLFEKYISWIFSLCLLLFFLASFLPSIHPSNMF